MTPSMNVSAACDRWSLLASQSTGPEASCDESTGTLTPHTLAATPMGTLAAAATSATSVTCTVMPETFTPTRFPATTGAAPEGAARAAGPASAAAERAV